MKKSVVILFVIAALMLTLAGCSSASAAEENAPIAEPQTATDVQTSTADPADSPRRQDGERFNAVIVIEGMEETVHYEHVINQSLGFEMDYDYESFERHSEPGRELFISVWDDPANPENYLELTFHSEDADTVAAAVREDLSQTYDLTEESRELENAGSCLYIEASVLKGTNNMADQLQLVYIIPTADGCIVATEHLVIEASEGFGRRFSYMLNTLAVMDRGGDGTLSDEQVLSAIKNYCMVSNPDLEEIADAGEYSVYWEIVSSDEQQIVVLFRSYTGSLNRYYVDRLTGATYVTVFVPGVTDEEERTDENFNVRDYFSR